MAMPRIGTVLLIDEDVLHAERLLGRLHFRQHRVTVCSQPEEGIRLLSQSNHPCGVVILNVSHSHWHCLKTLRMIRRICSQAGRHPCPGILCTSVAYRGPQFRLHVERLGARLVYER